MKNRKSIFLTSFFSLLVIVWTISCSGRSGKILSSPVQSTANAEAEDLSQGRIITFVSPGNNSVFKSGSRIEVQVSLSSPDLKPDSIIVSFDSKRVTALKAAPWKFDIPAMNTKATGRKSVKVAAWLNGKVRTTLTNFVTITSDIVPRRYTYKVINTYPHDKQAFTQGLFYDRGVFYEGTGQDQSSLRKVQPETGNVLRQLNLNSNLFGEGITLYGGRIFEVTWQNHVGFVYDKETFRLINKFYYETEGWGLTTINDRIVMSDGTENLYFIEPESFTVASKIEVYDNEKKVEKLNELEYINGEIWANIWMTDLIARIDPATGKVLGYINLAGILKDPDTDTSENVLNGIAWDKEGNRIFVTGKNWPKLFEIKVIGIPE